MTDVIVVAYQRCKTQDPDHMIVNPTPGLRAELEERGFSPSSNGYIEIKDEDCPECLQDRIDYLTRNLRIADDCGDAEGVTEYVREIAALQRKE